MEIQRKLLLMFLCMAAANSLPSLFDDSDNQNLNSDSSVSPELGTVSSEPPDFTNLYANDDEFPLISGNIALADPGLDGATSLFQDLPAKDLSGSAAHLEDGDILRSLPAADSSIELAMDDFCPLGYWNRCCHDGYCFWAPSQVLVFLCSGLQNMWCCFDRPFGGSCHYETPSGVDKSEVFVEVYKAGWVDEEMCCRPTERLLRQPQTG